MALILIHHGLKIRERFKKNYLGKAGDELFELCLSMKIVMPHENHVNVFFLTHTQSPKNINFYIIFAQSEYLRHSGLF